MNPFTLFASASGDARSQGARRGGPALLAASVYFVVLACTMTWPQVVSMTAVPPHQDPRFSIWRLAWIQHAVATGSPLFDANIFFPEPRTLAYSDATLLQGLLAAPIIGAGVSPVVAYNVLVLLSFIACGLGTYLWSRTLGVGFTAGLVAGTVFAFSPMRFDQYVHLEMLWTPWLPLSFWACRILVMEGGGKTAVLLGGCLALQALSGLYGFVFLTSAITVYAAMTMLVEPGRFTLRCTAYLGLAALIAGLIVVPYAQPYLANARILGSRSAEELQVYGASLHDFVTASPRNVVHGWTGRAWGRPEHQLFPGALAVVLALFALSRPVRTAWPLIAILVLGVELARGGHGVLFQALGNLGLGYGGLRVPARAGVLVHLGLAGLAALGWERLIRHWPNDRTRRVIVAAGLAVMLAEYWSPVALEPLATRRSVYSTWLAAQEGEVVAEFPLPLPHALPGDDPLVQYESVFHWQKMINGYSGYYPASYAALLHVCVTWGSPCLDALRKSGVTLVTLHLGRRSDSLSAVSLEHLERDPNLRPVMTAESLTGIVRVYRIADRAPGSSR